jgi:hypothetical protein
MTTVTTAANRSVCISHFSYAPPPSPAPAGTTLCKYTHFDLTEEELNCSARYNCWGFTFIPRRYAICTDVDVDKILQDNCIPIADGSIQKGDVIRYRKYGITQHTGRVWETDGAGHAKTIRSKWGPSGEYFHPPLTVPTIYGTDLAYFRQHSPLKGVADLWIRDSPIDDGEQFSHVPWWTSPDILVDVPPYDSIPDLNPKFQVANRVWARIQNRSNLAVENMYVRYYWADPAAGLPPSAWHLIPGTVAHPNPAGPLAIQAYGTIDAPYVEWTPSASPAHQCLLAIAYINDDPADSYNPDPIVYPFDIPWENNIGQRNVHIINPAVKGTRHSLSIKLMNPFPSVRGYVGKIQAIMTEGRHLPFFSPGKPVNPPEIMFKIDKGKKVSLKKANSRDIAMYKQKFPRPAMHPSEKLVAMKVFPNLRFKGDESHFLNIDINVPYKAKPWSIYYLHILHEAANRVAGGYTVVITVKEKEAIAK